MNDFSKFSSGTAAFLALGMIGGAVAPIVISAPATAATFATFTDISTNWSRPFIEALSAKKILTGYSDRTFRPNQQVTRAQLITMLRQAFDENKVNLSNQFDLSAAEDSLTYALVNGTYSTRRLRSTDKLTRAQVLVSLVRGLGLQSSNSPEDILNVFGDDSNIPQDLVDDIAAATENGIVVNYPNVRTLAPNKIATRADVAAFVYQALVNQEALNPLSSRSVAYKYIVQGTTDNNNQADNGSYDNGGSQTNQSGQYRVSRNTTIRVTGDRSNRVVITPGETVSLTLLVAEDIRDSQGRVLIPRNSEIEGQLVPRYSGSRFIGTQFVAQSLNIGNRSYNNINATSSVVAGQQSSNLNQGTLQNAAISAAAQVLLGRVTGQRLDPISILGSLGGVLGGQSGGSQQQDQVIVINPENDLRLTLGSDLYVSNVSNNQRY